MDREDLAFGIESGVDYVALSFVRSAKEILEAKELIRKKDADIPVIAKIEHELHHPPSMESIQESLSTAF